MRYLYAALLALSLFGCKSCPGPGPTPVPVGEVCLLAEQNLLRLACTDSEGRLLGGPNKRGEPFHEICETAVTNSVDVNPQCLSTIQDCSEVDSCPR